MLRRMFTRKLLLVLVCVCAVAAFAAADRADLKVAGPVKAKFAPVPIPNLRYCMASPRAALIGPPVWATNAYYLPSGAAENFARKPGSMRVRVGSRVRFCLSDETEGVWYANSYGTLGTSLTLQWCVACKCENGNWKECMCNLCDCEACQCADCAGCALDEVAVDETLCPWVTIGRDGAKATRKGPSVGHAKVGVPVRFSRPGIYYLRGIITTYARPWYPLPVEQWDHLLMNDGTGDVLPEIPAAVDRDVVYVRVHVLKWPVATVEPLDEVSADPDAEFCEAVPREDGLEEPGEVEIAGDEAIVPGGTDNQVGGGNGASDTQKDRERKMDQSEEPAGTMIRDRDRVSRVLGGDPRR